MIPLRAAAGFWRCCRVLEGAAEDTSRQGLGAEEGCDPSLGFWKVLRVVERRRGAVEKCREALERCRGTVERPWGAVERHRGLVKSCRVFSHLSIDFGAGIPPNQPQPFSLHPIATRLGAEARRLAAGAHGARPSPHQHPLTFLCPPLSSCLPRGPDETLRSLAAPPSPPGQDPQGWRAPVDCVRANELCAAEPSCSSRYRTLRQCLAGRDRNTMLANKECQAALEVLQESPLYDCRCKRGMKKELQCLQIYWSIHLGLTEGTGLGAAGWWW